MELDPVTALRGWEIGTYLERLAARRPMPAGGVTAALSLAQAAALLTMVARIMGEPAAEVLERAPRLQERALGLTDDDMRVFDAVTAAAALPRGTERSTAVAAALVAAAGPPAEVIVLGGEAIELAERLAEVTTSAVIADVAAAAELAAAAISISRTNVESNIRDAAPSDETARLRALLAPVDGVLARAAAIGDAARARPT